MSQDQQQTFFDPKPEGEGPVVVNDRVTMRTSGGQRVVVVDGVIVQSFAVADRAAEAYAMVFLVEAGYADQNDVARAFGCATRTLRRHQERYDEGGLAALGRKAGRPAGTRQVKGKHGARRDRAVLGLKAEGVSNREVGRRLGISEKAVRKRLKKLGWEPPAEQTTLFEEEGPEDPAPDPPTRPSSPAPGPEDVPRSSPEAKKVEASSPVSRTAPAEAAPTEEASSKFESGFTSLDVNPLDRSMDRLLARLGLLDDAQPMFAACDRVVRGGALLAVPGLLRSGVLEVAEEVYGKTLAPAFFGLRTTIVALSLFALLRIKRPEALKEYSPPDLGRVLGLDRAPEVKTLRRKLARLAACGRSERFGHELARRRVAARGRMLGFLYVDGHVRVYHGKHSLPKAHVPQMRLAVPATTDYWVNDTKGEPLFVITAEANAGMCKMLVEVTAEVRKLVGPKRRPTMVFDRGGWSPKLFVKLMAEGFEVLTYRKGRAAPIPEKEFKECAGQVEGRRMTYRLDDREVQFLKGTLTLRQVTRLTNDGHQTSVLTSRRDLRAVEVAYRMFERWRQENFFKYAAEEFAIDALVDYDVEPSDPNRSVPNPDRKALDAELATARAELAKLLQQYGAAAAANPESERPTMRGFKIAHGKLGKKVRAARDRIVALEARRSQVDKRVPVSQVLGDRPAVKLSTERKHLTNVLKMIAYQVESDLVALVSKSYARVETEGRTLVQAALQSTAGLAPDGRTLRVRLEPQSSAHRSRAVGAICDGLNADAPCFPGTHLALRYEVSEVRTAG